MFCEALGLSNEQRSSFLDLACADAPELRDEVEAMLESADEDTAPSIERRLLSPEGAEREDPFVGTQLGPYRLIAAIGRGGMGSVYLAERSDGHYSQRVAVKIVRFGRLGADLQARFRVERQVLARLDHPDIATLLDGGVTEEGLPYLVMEVIDGRPITEYCDERRLSIAERLRLFERTCRAVQHAHSHLIVHRDLKPSNILVTPEGEVRLLDFGIAKLLDPAAFDLPGHETVTRDRFLTPRRSAPEQLTGGQVTTAADVYALGILLYELVVGRLPHATRADPVETLRAITTLPPRRPAQALLEDEAPPAAEVARRRASTVGQLTRRVRGDLGSIALFALRTEAEGRYASADLLADDVLRYLEGKPVVAHGDTAGYRLRRFVQRHLLASAVTTALVLGLVAFAVTSALQARRLQVQRDRLALEKQHSEQVVTTLVDLLGSSAPGRAQGEEMKVADFLRRAESRADALADQPELQRRLLHVLGRTHLARRVPGDARALLERAWAAGGGSDEMRSEAERTLFHDLARATWLSGDHERGRAMLKRSVEAATVLHGERSLVTAQARQDWADALEARQAARVLREVVATRRALAADDDSLASALNDLAVAHHEMGDRGGAERLLRESLDLVEKLHGPDHPSTLAVLGNLAGVLASNEESVAMQRELLDRKIRVFGERSAFVGQAWNTLGVSLAHAGNMSAALEAFEEAHRIQERGGARGLGLANSARNVARLLELSGRPEEAIPFYEQAVAQAPSARHRAGMSSQMSISLFRAGHRDEAVEVARAACRALEAHPLDGDAFDEPYSSSLVRLGRLLADHGAAADAEPVLRDALERLEASTRPPTALVAEARCALGRTLIELGRPAEARPLVEAGLPALSSLPLADPAELGLCRAAGQAARDSAP